MPPKIPTTRTDVVEVLVSLSPLAIEIHTTACEKGWWDVSGPEGKIPVRDPFLPKLHTRNFGEIIMLAVSELAEALECYRTGKPVTEVWIENGKPEGFPIEIADAVIRLLDNLVAAGPLVPVTEDQVLLMLNVRQSDNVPEQLLRITSNLCDAYYYCSQGTQPNDQYTPDKLLGRIVATIIIFCHHHGIDVLSAVIQKMKYNASRPYRHGGKIA
jgi:hypothetical protein